MASTSAETTVPVPPMRNVTRWSILILILGICVRYTLFYYQWDSIFSRRPELTTPCSSIHRAKEGYFLLESSKSPYAGDVFHQPPLVLALLIPFLKLKNDMALWWFFIICDTFVALILRKICVHIVTREQKRVLLEEKKGIWHQPLSPLFQAHVLPDTVMMIYLMNPYTLFSCIAMSTTVLSHFFVVLALWRCGCADQVIGLLALAFATYINPYCIILTVPCHLILQSAKGKQCRGILGVVSYLISLGFFSTYLAFFLVQSKHVTGSWDFLQSTYLWVIDYPDLTPNIGVFWYFFAEVFDRFRAYFIWIFFAHIGCYVLPMTLRLHRSPHVLAHVLVGIYAMFQAYPSMSDSGFFLSLLSMHPYTISFMRMKYVIVIGLCVGSCLMAVMWHLWLYPGSGNANFFYNQTLVYQAFFMHMITEFIGSTMHREKPTLWSI